MIESMQIALYQNTKLDILYSYAFAEQITVLDLTNRLRILFGSGFLFGK